jgi:hypothetical protein
MAIQARTLVAGFRNIVTELAYRWRLEPEQQIGSNCGKG